jgi:Glyoxalase-like domain
VNQHDDSLLGMRMGAVVIDCADPDRLATFWAGLLGVEKYKSLGEPVKYAGIAPIDWGAPYMSFQRVPEPRRRRTVPIWTSMSTTLRRLRSWPSGSAPQGRATSTDTDIAGV